MRLICINCPRGCELDVVKAGDTVTVKGYACARGEEYGHAEVLNPVRMVTGLVKVAGSRRPLPVKTRVAVSKGRIADITNLLANTTVVPPGSIGDIIVPDVCGTGVDIVATADF